MRPESNPAHIIARNHSTNELNEKPIAEHHPGRHGDRGEKNKNRYEHVDPYPRVENQVRAHDAADRSRGADHGNDRVRIGNDLAERGGKTAGQIKYQKAQATHGIFDVVTEQPEEPHVTQKMHPPAVEKHRCDQVRYLAPGIGAANEPGPQWEAATDREQSGQLSRYEPEIADRPGQGDL